MSNFYMSQRHASAGHDVDGHANHYLLSMKKPFFPLYSLVLILALLSSSLGGSPSQIYAAAREKASLPSLSASVLHAPAAADPVTCLVGRGDECIPIQYQWSCVEPVAYSECPTWNLRATITGTLSNRKPDEPNPSGEWFQASKDNTALDTYVFGDASTAPINFNIPMRRIYSPLVKNDTTADGFLNPYTLSKLISSGILKTHAELHLAVYDVDYPAVSGCTENNVVTVNGFPVESYPATIYNTGSGSQAVGGDSRLYGLNNTWTVWVAKVPVGNLRFSKTIPNHLQDPAGQPDLVNQQVSIQVSPNCPDKRAITVGWGALYIPSPTKPVVFVHGWSSFGGVWKEFSEHLENDFGIDSDNAATDGNRIGLSLTNRGFRSLDHSAQEVADYVAKFRRSRGLHPLDPINIVAHSRGGLASRMAIQRMPPGSVANLITIATPHHGVSPGIVEGLRYAVNPSDLDPISCNLLIQNMQDECLKLLHENFIANLCSSTEAPDACLTSAEQLTTDYLVDLNYDSCDYSGLYWSSALTPFRSSYRRPKVPQSFGWWQCNGLKFVPTAGTNYVHVATQVIPDVNVGQPTDLWVDAAGDALLAGMSIGDGLVEPQGALIKTRPL